MHPFFAERYPAASSSYTVATMKPVSGPSTAALFSDLAPNIIAVELCLPRIAISLSKGQSSSALVPVHSRIG